MAHPQPLDDRERENLSAYLDGELDKPSARALEAKLSVNAGARAEANALRRAWEMLDYLPRPEPSPDFTQRTVSRLTVPPPPAAGARPAGVARGRLFRAAWAAAVLVAVAGGFAGADRYFRRAPVDLHQQLARDLRVIENLRGYEAVDDIDFLHQLADADDPDLFGDDNLGS